MQTALLLIDVQQSFVHRPYWGTDDVPAFLAHSNQLVAGCLKRGVPVVRIFHTEGPGNASNPFAPESGSIRPLEGLDPFEAAATFEKHRHSALVGTGLPVWLRQHGINRLIIAGIRTEQCCETTARHASDEGFEVDYVTAATLTFNMPLASGALLTAAQIRERTAAALDQRFATVTDVQTAHQRAA